MKDSPDLYRILQVDPDADPEVIDAVYRRLARKYHPDVNPSADANRQMQEINMAYEVLSNPQRRSEYDRQFRPWLTRRPRQTRGTARATRPSRAKPRRRYSDDTPPRPCLVSQPEVLEFGTLSKGDKRSAVLKVKMTQGRSIRGRVVANQRWINVVAPEPLDELNEVTLDVAIDTTHLRDGVYHYGSVSIESLAYGGLTVPVIVYVEEEPRPELRAEPQLIEFDAVLGQSPKFVRTLRIWDAAGIPMSGSLHVKPSWLKADIVDFEEVRELHVDLVADVSGLRAGQTYSGRIEVHATNGRATLLVKMTVLPAETPLPDCEDSAEWLQFLAALEPVTEWERAFLQTATLQAKQRGWRPSSSQRATLESMWRRRMEKN